MHDDFAKAYVAAEHEAELYRTWEESGAFAPHADTSKPAFSLVMPPPNANGNLHMGHALEVSIMDILTRYHRMLGDRTLWVPGSDHAGIETQVVFEKLLEKEGRSRFQMTREQFYKEVYAFTQGQKEHMEGQLRMLGASPDWSAERFTLDPKVIETVYATFRRMYEEGLIYRGERIVNYSVKYQTAYADIEVVHEERTDTLYFLKYGPITVATVRPETQFGDVAIAVHPEDERYKEWVGKEVEVTFANGQKKMLPVIADDYVKPEFGTGALKITPAHDPNDFELAQRHDLPIVPVIDTRGRLLPIAGEFEGQKSAEARANVAAKLEEMGLVEKSEPYTHMVGLCYKSNQPIEPLVMPQWYVKVQPLAEDAIKAIERGEVRFEPEGFKKIELDWLRGLKDWNISRQIWWGIPIKDAMPDNPEVASDTDTFDTWFSSGQWPYAVMQAMSGSGRDYLEEFYPTTVMQTGRDLVFSWVTRMLMLGLYTQGKVPFKTVYFHGMVLDGKGKKMSKSKGNVVSPIELVAKYGADAVRFGLMIGASAGSDIPLPEEKIIGGRNFANKLWNVSRFVLMQLGDTAPSQLPAGEAQTEADRTILAQLDQVVRETGEHIDAFRFAQALQGIHEFVWHQFADVYIEAAKAQPGPATQAVLYRCLTTALKLLHPFMPFVTEAIWQRLPETGGLLMTAAWPQADKA